MTGRWPGRLVQPNDVAIGEHLESCSHLFPFNPLPPLVIHPFPFCSFHPPSQLEPVGSELWARGAAWGPREVHGLGRLDAVPRGDGSTDLLSFVRHSA